jgi:hypothetical protein
MSTGVHLAAAAVRSTSAVRTAILEMVVRFTVPS